MTRFQSAHAQSNQTSAAACTAVATCRAFFATTVNSAVITVLGTTLLVSIFVALSLITLVRLQAIIILVVSIITLVLIQLHRPPAILKEPPELP